MTGPDPSSRARLRRLLEAGEALRAAAEAFDDALDDAPFDQVGLRIEVSGVDDDNVNDLVDRVADRLGVADDAEERRSVPTLKAARDVLELANRILACELTDVVERLTGVVDARVTPVLADVERALVADLAPKADPPVSSPKGKPRRGRAGRA
jgi:hypothetical protein